MDDEKVKSQIGANIAACRKRIGLTQAGLAEKLNYSDKAISQWERGESIPDVLTLMQIAEQFQVTVDDLLGDVNALPDNPTTLERAMTQVSEKALRRKANKNIILAAEQAKELVDCEITVIPTKSFPQGLSAAIALEPDKDAKDNAEVMGEAAAAVKSAEVTRAVRDTVLHGESIAEGQVLGILEGDIVVHCDDMNTAVFSLLDKMADADENSVISVYYGEGVSDETAEELSALIEEK